MGGVERLVMFRRPGPGRSTKIQDLGRIAQERSPEFGNTGGDGYCILSRFSRFHLLDERSKAFVPPLLLVGIGGRAVFGGHGVQQVVVCRLVALSQLAQYS